MASMFENAVKFNQPIGYGAYVFDTPIGSLDISSLGRHDQMFHALTPPCGAGREPGRNLLMCERCGVARRYCQECPEGSTPSADRTTCENCLMMHYSVSGMDECVPCNLPLALVDNRCVWWHLPLLALGLGALGVCSGLVFFWNRSRKAKKIERILEEVYMELWDEQPNTLNAYSKRLSGLGLRKVNFDQHISGMRALQSQRAGVSIGYLLSADFAQLAIQRAGKDDPTFTDMKTSFWLSEDPIGEDIICPRDGRPGCALVDWIPRRERREQTHFMSWTWKYSLQQVEFIMPRDASDHMQRQIAQGSNGIDEVIKSLSQVDSEEAKAWSIQDEIKVKSLIQDSVGFKHVDVHVTNVMITWIGRVLEHSCRELLDRARGENMKKGDGPQVPQAEIEVASR